jgi:hypothetical protein
MNNNLMTKLVEKIEARGGLPGTGGKSESISKLYNKLKANTDQSTVNNMTKDCIMKQNQRNVVQIFGSDVSDSNFAQVNKAFIDCMQTYDEVKAIDSDISNAAKQELDKSVTSSAMDIAASFASLGTSALPLIISIIVAVVSAFILLGISDIK